MPPQMTERTTPVTVQVNSVSSNDTDGEYIVYIDVAQNENILGSAYINPFITADQHTYLCKQCRSRWDCS